MTFEDGVIVIKHWRLHNNLTANRYQETKFIEDKSFLKIKDNGAYSLDHGEPIDDTHYIEVGKRETKQRRDIDETKTTLDKNRLDKNSIGKDSINNKYIVPFSTELKEIIDYLNLCTGSRYTYKNESNNKHIRARLNEGFTVEDFKTVIDKKTKTWKGTDMEGFLRPETLFCPKHFESYLNEPVIDRKSKGSFLDLLEKEGDIID